MGPFTTSPFEVEATVAPINIYIRKKKKYIRNNIYKKDYTERLVIVDLSFPKHSPGLSINGRIIEDAY